MGVSMVVRSLPNPGATAAQSAIFESSSYEKRIVHALVGPREISAGDSIIVATTSDTGIIMLNGTRIGVFCVEDKD